MICIPFSVLALFILFLMVTVLNIYQGFVVVSNLIFVVIAFSLIFF